MPFQSKRSMDTNATRWAILQAGKKCFGDSGYALTNVEKIASLAGMTTGAMYHHFANKKELFTAVAVQVEKELVEKVAQRTRNNDPWTDLLESVDYALELCLMSHVRQIAFIDAPNVIGTAAWRSIQAQYGLGILVTTLRDLKQNGIIAISDPELGARMLLAALIEAAGACSTPPNDLARLIEARRLLKSFVATLKV